MDPDVARVCADHDLLPALRTSVRLLHEAFRSVHDLSAEVDVDPDTDERRIVIDAVVDGPIEELLSRYFDYTRDWVRLVPPELREWIRLAYHPLRDA